MSFPALRSGCPPVFLLTRKQNVMRWDPFQWRNVCNTSYMPIARPIQKSKYSHTNGTMISFRLIMSLCGRKRKQQTDDKRMTWQPQHILTSARPSLISVRLSSRCVRFITREMKYRQHNYYSYIFNAATCFDLKGSSPGQWYRIHKVNVYNCDV
jgi:hypothetical protein